jgi:hypothetical protein
MAATGPRRSLAYAQSPAYGENMEAISLRAHFDGECILLDEPFPLLPNTPLLVTVLTPELAAEREEWSRIAAQGLGRAYADDEPEYSAADVKR